jgi:hypothetical protein
MRGPFAIKRHGASCEMRFSKVAIRTSKVVVLPQKTIASDGMPPERTEYNTLFFNFRPSINKRF